MITLKSFIYAIRGIADVLSSQRNARFHLLTATLVIIFAIVLSVYFPQIALTAQEFAAVIFAIFLVFLSEIFNSAIEETLNIVRPSAKHPGAGKVKDMAAGAVLVSAIGAVLIGIIVFLPKILALWYIYAGNR